MPEQIDYHSLPDDPRMAFATLVEIFDEQLQNETESLDRNEDNRQALVSHTAGASQPHEQNHGRRPCLGD